MTAYSSPCPFCRIARREVPAHIVYEDDHLVAFLCTGLVRPGQVQIIPRDHYPTFDDLTAELASRIVILGQRLARILKTQDKVSGAAFLFSGGRHRTCPCSCPADDRAYWHHPGVPFRRG